MPGNGTIDIGSEQLGRAAEVAPGFWIIATRHRPGFSRFQPEINNRCLVFRLRDRSDGGREVLLVVNAVEDDQALSEVRRIGAETGLPIRYLISPGGGHHVMLPAWHDALPDTKVLVAPTRIPRTVTGKRLASSPRWVVYDSRDPLPMFKGELDALSFDGLLGFRENLTPKEGGKDSVLGMLKIMLTEMPPKDPIDELWLHHVATGTVIGGENLGWILSKEAHAAFPFMLRMMMKSEQVYLMGGARRVQDAQRVAEHWKTILSWPARALMTYHDTPGTAFTDRPREKLAAAVTAAKQA
jgi:hypothetical protein